MPTENDKTNAPAATEAEKALEDKLASAASEPKVVAKNELKEVKAENAQLKKDLADANNRVSAIERKLKEVTGAAVPEGNYCVLNGKTYQVEGTVSARFAGDEGRKGHLPEGIDTELVILKR